MRFHDDLKNKQTTKQNILGSMWLPFNFEPAKRKSFVPDCQQIKLSPTGSPEVKRILPGLRQR